MPASAIIVMDHRTSGAQRLVFVDGLRGIAALVVAVGHIIGMAPPDHPSFTFRSANLEHKLIWPWLFGGPMVWLFIMLSGFSLYWSEESRISSGKARTKLTDYVGRRAWRILPTYYVALVIGFVVVLPLGSLLVKPSPSLSTYSPVTPTGVLSHIFLLHNLSASWVHQINPPLWSIAVEAQLYVLFPVLLRMGLRWRPYLPAMAAVVLVGAVNEALSVTAFGLVIWFAAGVVLAHLARRWRLPHRILLTAGLVLLIVALYRGPYSSSRFSQLLWIFTFSLFISALSGIRDGGLNIATSRPAVWLGQRSYSLYALHFPIALLVWAAVGRTGLRHVPALMLTLALGTPAALCAAHLCYRGVELPSLERVRRVGVRRPEPLKALGSD